MQITDVPIDLTTRTNQPCNADSDPRQLNFEVPAHQPIPSTLLINDIPYTMPSLQKPNTLNFMQPQSTGDQESNQIEKCSDSGSINQGESLEDSPGTQVRSTNDDGKTSMTIGSKRRTSNNSDSSEASADSGSFDHFKSPTDIPNSDYSLTKKKMRTEIGKSGDTDEKFSVSSRNIYPPSVSPESNGRSNYEGVQTRPFKAMSGRLMEPLPLSGPLGDFEVFRQNVLSKVNTNIKSTNENMRRRGSSPKSEIKDPLYLEKRRKNNEAAKRSRDARRRKEDELAIRCAYLEQERMLLLQENKILKEKLNKYRYGYLMALPRRKV